MIDLYETLALIVNAHGDQKYGDGPYYLHPVEVLTNLKHPTYEEMEAALLHDVIEDTELTIEDLRKKGYSETTLEIVGLLTKDESLTYDQNIQRIIDSGNVSAMRIKYADNKANSSVKNLEKLKPARQEKLKKKYAASMAMLEEALKNVEGNSV